MTVEESYSNFLNVYYKPGSMDYNRTVGRSNGKGSLNYSKVLLFLLDKKNVASFKIVPSEDLSKLDFPRL